MTDTIQMRTTTEQSGDYRVYAAKGDTPLKGLAIHTDILSRLSGEPDYIEVDVAEGEAAVPLEAFGATSATVKVRSGTAVRNGYVEPVFLSQYDGDFTFEGKETDLSAVPSFGIAAIRSSDEETYDESQSSSAEDAADALFGDSDEAEADADEAEADDSDEDTVEVSDEELGIAE